MTCETNDGEPRRKRRTREHVIEDLSENHLERLVLLRGHILRRPARDYGVDVTMFHFAHDGQIENGEIRFQLKATDRLRKIDEGATLSIPIQSGDLNSWCKETYPFILVLFDATSESAFWLDAKEYVQRNPKPTSGKQKTVNVHIPVTNALNIDAIDLFRQKSLQVIARLRERGPLRHVPKKPR